MENSWALRDLCWWGQLPVKLFHHGTFRRECPRITPPQTGRGPQISPCPAEGAFRQPGIPNMWVYVTRVCPILQPPALGCGWRHTGEADPPPLLPQPGAGAKSQRGRSRPGLLSMGASVPGCRGPLRGQAWGPAEGAGCDLSGPLLMGKAVPRGQDGSLHTPCMAAPTVAFLPGFCSSWAPAAAGGRGGRAGRGGGRNVCGACRPPCRCVTSLPPSWPMGAQGTHLSAARNRDWSAVSRHLHGAG